MQRAQTKIRASRQLTPLCPLDVVFRHLVHEILSLLSSPGRDSRHPSRDKHIHRRVTAWIAKLSEPMRLTAWKRNRNLYAGVLLGMLTRGQLQRPFDVGPCGGTLPTMPSWMKMHASEADAAAAAARRRRTRRQYVEDDTRGEEPYAEDTGSTCASSKKVSQNTGVTTATAGTAGWSSARSKRVTFGSPRSDTLLHSHRLERQLAEEKQGIEELRLELERERFRSHEWRERCEDAETRVQRCEQERREHSRRAQSLLKYMAQWQQRVDSLAQHCWNSGADPR